MGDKGHEHRRRIGLGSYVYVPAILERARQGLLSNTSKRGSCAFFQIKGTITFTFVNQFQSVVFIQVFMIYVAWKRRKRKNDWYIQYKLIWFNMNKKNAHWSCLTNANVSIQEKLSLLTVFIGQPWPLKYGSDVDVLQQRVNANQPASLRMYVFCPHHTEPWNKECVHHHHLKHKHKDLLNLIELCCFRNLSRMLFLNN